MTTDWKEEFDDDFRKKRGEREKNDNMSLANFLTW